jgi:hypothetical protein
VIDTRLELVVSDQIIAVERQIALHDDDRRRVVDRFSEPVRWPFRDPVVSPVEDPVVGSLELIATVDLGSSHQRLPSTPTRCTTPVLRNAATSSA